MRRYIKTHRSKDLKRSALVVAKYLIDGLKIHNEVKLGDIYENLKSTLKIQQKDFMYTLNFLYILGKIEYIQETDMLRLSDETI